MPHRLFAPWCHLTAFVTGMPGRCSTVGSRCAGAQPSLPPAYSLQGIPPAVPSLCREPCFDGLATARRRGALTWPMPRSAIAPDECPSGGASNIGVQLVKDRGLPGRCRGAHRKLSLRQDAFSHRLIKLTIALC